MEEEEAGRKEVAEGGKGEIFFPIFPSVASSHTRVLLIPGVLSAYLWDESKPSVNYIKYSLPNSSLTSICFYQTREAPLGYAQR